MSTASGPKRQGSLEVLAGYRPSLKSVSFEVSIKHHAPEALLFRGFLLTLGYRVVRIVLDCLKGESKMFSVSSDELDKNTLIDHHGARWVRQDVKTVDFLRTLRVIRRGLPTAHQYLEKIRDKHAWAEAWLTHGRTFLSPSRLSCKSLSEAGLVLELNQCYHNALLVSRVFKERYTKEDETKIVHYVEGLAVTPVGPYRHAWIAIDGYVLDPTWEDAYSVSYFGVAFDPDFVESVARTTGRYSVMMNWDKCRHMVLGYLESGTDS